MELAATSAAMSVTVRLLFTAAALGLLAGVAHAETSPWSEDLRSAVRLMSGDTSNKPMQAGVEMRLQKGWHTYWRYPGDSGVPPQFDFAKSDNLKSASVLYPAPELHTDAAGQTIVYQQDIIFPVEVVAQDASKPVKLHLALDYAVCENMCVPARGEAELTIAPGNSAPDPRLQSALARVPAKESAADAGLIVKREGNSALVSFPTPADTSVTIFVEGPSKDWALPIPKPVDNAPAGQRAFRFKLEGQPPGTDISKPVDLTITIVEGRRAFEVTARLD
jgi:DsbC/DsbD-like thiol-disulfide interchange protein